MPAYYSNNINKFLEEPRESIIGKLQENYSHSGFYQQLNSFIRSCENEIDILKNNLNLLTSKNINIEDWGILLEYDIPRRAKRIDTVLITDKFIIVIEFKVGKSKFDSGDKKQIIDYCNDLVDFHLQSRNKIIIPILLATEADITTAPLINKNYYVQELILTNKKNLIDVLKHLLSFNLPPQGLNFHEWEHSAYLPTPSIIEAAKELYAGHNVFEILHNSAESNNLKHTCDCLFKIINDSKVRNRKSICFVTGVPGAGKTLVGMNIIHNKELYEDISKFGTYLSGNLPLVKVLSKALNTNTLVQNVHIFFEHLFKDKDKITDEQVVVFDEAQRAWNAEHSNRKFERPFSEAEMMLEIMSRKNEGATIVALIGNGQEINTGEAGLIEWGKALQGKFQNWDIYISPLLLNKTVNSPYQYLFETLPTNLNVFVEEKLNLKVSLRYIRSQKIADWVEYVLNGNYIEAKKLYPDVVLNYPLYLTRSLETAKEWLKSERLTEKFGEIKTERNGRYGLIASSGARRLRAYGLDVKSRLDEAEWFLNDKDDVRSSFFLEQPATEFSIQGLEIDWACLCWGEDLRMENEQWSYYNFWGTIWRNTVNEIDKTYTLNKYRVLLTRAREGMIIWVPQGSDEDVTRKKEYNDGTADYLKRCGLIEI